MECTILQAYKGQLFIGTETISRELGTYHFLLTRMIKIHPDLFLKFGEIIPHYKKTGRKGGQIKQFLLNVPQTRLMISLIQNIPLKVWEVTEKAENELDFFKSLEEFLKS